MGRGKHQRRRSLFSTQPPQLRSYRAIGHSNKGIKTKCKLVHPNKKNRGTWHPINKETFFKNQMYNAKTEEEIVEIPSIHVKKNNQRYNIDVDDIFFSKKSS